MMAGDLPAGIVGGHGGDEIGAAVVAFWPWGLEETVLTTLRSSIAGAPHPTVLLPEGRIAASLALRLSDSERSRIVFLSCRGDNLSGFLGWVAAAYPGADLGLVAEAGVLPQGWLGLLCDAAHADDTVAAATSQTVGGPQPSFPGLLQIPRGAGDGATLAPRVLLPEPSCCLIRRTAFDLLGGLDPRFSHPHVLLADFAARGRELGLSCALAAGAIVFQSQGRLDPSPPDQLERLYHRHPWLPAACTDETALDAGALKHALIANRARRQGMSVTIDARSLGSGFGGTQTYVGELLLALARSGRVAVRAVLAARPDPEFAAALADAGVESVSYDQAASGALTRTDVVHRPQQVFTLSDLRLLALIGERLVVSHMDLIGYRAPTYHASVDNWRAYRRSTRLALSCADRVIFFSDHARRDAIAEQLISEARACVVGIGVRPIPEASDSDRPAGVPSGREFLLMIGADYAHKNRPFALELVEQLRLRHGWQGAIVLAGAHVANGSSAPVERELLRSRPELASHVIDLGPVSEAEKRWLLRSAMAHLAPSAYEGFGLAPLEAAAAGRPCIYAPCTSLREIIDSGAATIVPWDAAASADAAAPLLHPGPARNRHLALLAQAMARFSWDRVVPQILASYEEAIASPYRGTVSWEELEREALVVTLQDAYEQLDARVRDGLALIDARGSLLTRAEQRGLMRVASRPWLRGPLLGGFGLLGIDQREPRTAPRADGEPAESAT